MKQDSSRRPLPNGFDYAGHTSPYFQYSGEKRTNWDSFSKKLDKSGGICPRSMVFQISGMPLSYSFWRITTANTHGNLPPAALFDISQFKDAPGQSIVYLRDVGDETLQFRAFLLVSSAEIWNLL